MAATAVGTGYRGLVAGPGWPLVVRADLAPNCSWPVDHRSRDFPGLP
ncbi:hypothetical protein [Saccharothrix variisporea]|nr:hypothetical protein [Saccharothrix variisporea]